MRQSAQQRAGLSIGIIMDGNGRWAAERGLPRFEGHRRGVEALRKAVEAAPDLGVSHLTLYSFSKENWTRPQREILDLMGLLKRFIRNDLANLNRNRIKVNVIGDRAGLSRDIVGLLQEAEDLTRANNRMVLNIAFNYGSRQEIAFAAQALAREVAAGRLSAEAITPELLSQVLQTAGQPDPDFIIRTSGEQRLSNFLLWQSAYAEFVFLPIHWPEFNAQALSDAIAEFSRRQRRFGGLQSVHSPRSASAS